MQTILIIEPDNPFAQTLAQELKKIGPATISTVPTIPEGCLILSQRPQSLVFLPLTSDVETLVRAVRALQPNVPIVLTQAEETAVSLTNRQLATTQVQGILPHSHVKQQLPQLIDQALTLPKPATRPLPPPPAITEPWPQPQDVQQLLERIEVGDLVQTVILSQHGTLIASHGQHNATAQTTFAAQSGQDWDKRHTARLQFAPKTNGYGEVLLYSRTLSAGYLLTLVAATDVALRDLRLRAEDLTAVIQQLLDGQQPAIAPPPAFSHSQPSQHEKRISYNIAWQPQKPLRPDLQIPLRRTLRRLAHENACILTYVAADPELIHLHINCPASRGSDWVAYLLKNGSEAIIQQEYHLTEPLWETGYYAAESAKPLSDNELRLLLEKRELS